MTQSLQRQRYHTGIDRQGIIISNFLEWKKTSGRDPMMHLWDMLNRPDTDKVCKTFQQPPKVVTKNRKKWDVGVHLLPIFRLIIHEHA